MQLSRLEFGALLSYSPRGDSSSIQNSKNLMTALKTDQFVGNPKIPMSQWIADTIGRNKSALPFFTFFNSTAILVPAPSSSLMKADSLWIPERLAAALVRTGLGKEVARCLTRVEPVPKAALSEPKDRPTAAQHYETISIQGSLSKPDEIMLIDVVTRGATLLGATNRLVDAFPGTRIRAFAAMRTISNPTEFENWYKPCVGTIELRDSGDTLRRP